MKKELCKYVRKAFCMGLVVTLTVSMLSGCKSGKKAEKEKEVAMGRYVEEEVPMPENVTGGEECAFRLTKNEKGEIVVLTSDRGKEEKLHLYTYQDDKWTENKEDWINAKEGLDNFSYSKDGTVCANYIQRSKKGDQVTIMLIKTDGTTEEVAIKDFEKQTDITTTPSALVEIGENRYFSIGYLNAYIYDAGKTVASFEVGTYVYAIYENQVITVNKDGTGVEIHDLQTGELVNELTLQGFEGRGAFTTDEQGNWYLATDSGLYRITNDGSTWEMIIEGSLCKMSDPSAYIDEILNMAEQEFYVMYEYEEGRRILCSYHYDESIPTMPEESIHIVSFTNQPSINQTIQEFQQEYSDVLVNYEVISNQDSTVTKDDYIKNLNTELLAGDGPDLLLLDDLNADSYVEKGVLADLSEIIQPLVDSGELAKDMVQSYKTEDKIYTCPVRMIVPIVFGKEEVINAMKTLQNFVDYVGNSKEQTIIDPNTMNTADLLTILYTLYGNEMLQDGKVEEEGITEFLTETEALVNSLALSSQEEEVEGDYFTNSAYNWNSTQAIYEGIQEIGIGQITNMYDTYAVFEALKKQGGSIQTVQSQYIPSGMIAMNAKTTKKEMAEDFIRMLFSEEIQSKNLADGLPVNTKALENFQKDTDDFCMYTENFEATQPSEEKRQEIVALAKDSKLPIMIDETLESMILEGAEEYLSGNVPLEGAVEKIMSKVNVYLAE